MKKIVLPIVCTSVAAMFASVPAATDLVDVYNQALKTDPQFKESEATWLSAKTALPLARSHIFPLIDLGAGAARTHNRIDSTGQPTTNGWSSAYTYDISITQPVFNYAAWAGISEASAGVKSATAVYLFKTQDLMSRVANAYFEALRANQTLRYTLSEKSTLYQNLQQQKQEYKVGLIAPVGVYNAQSQYDTVVAEEIANRNALSDKLEDLRAITGVYYPQLMGLMSRVPLAKPKPSNINDWVNISAQHNYGILAQKYAVVAAREDIKVQAAANYPVLGLNADFSGSHNTAGITTPATDTQALVLGAKVDFPIFQGGATIAETDKARYDFLNSSATLEQTYRDTLNSARKSYLNINALVYKINADLQSIKSKQSNLSATQQGYNFGTRTMVDVLMAIQELTSAQKDFANDQYDYILSTIALKEAAGTLSVADLQQINRWLTDPLTFHTAITAKISPVSVNPNVSATVFDHTKTPVPYQTTNPIIKQGKDKSAVPSIKSSEKEMAKAAKLPSIRSDQVKLPKPSFDEEKSITASSAKTTDQMDEPFSDKKVEKTTAVKTQTVTKAAPTKDETTSLAPVTTTDATTTNTTTEKSNIEPKAAKQTTTAKTVTATSAAAITTPTKTSTPSISATTKSVTATVTTKPSTTEKPVTTTVATKPSAAEKSVTATVTTTTPSTAKKPVAKIVTTDTKTKTTIKSPSNITRTKPSKDFLTDPNAARKLPTTTVALNKHYSIQLFAAHKLSEVQSFIAKHKKLNLALASTSKDGKQWYEVLYGEFKDYSQAKSAKAKLPKNLQDRKSVV